MTFRRHIRRMEILMTFANLPRLQVARAAWYEKALAEQAAKNDARIAQRQNPDIPMFYMTIDGRPVTAHCSN